MLSMTDATPTTISNSYTFIQRWATFTRRILYSLLRAVISKSSRPEKATKFVRLRLTATQSDFDCTCRCRRQ